jgi:RNA polymerase sigma-70 factor (ECF subfamily)
MTEIEALVRLAVGGDFGAYGKLIDLTQRMVFGVCYRILGNHADASDASQQAYLRGFERLVELDNAAAFAGWMRQIAIRCARDLARKRRFSFSQPVELPDVAVLDESETSWSESQRQALATALSRLNARDRRVCDRFYHGGWDIARLAADAGISEPAMRKRLQRIRDQLRKDVEMSEQQQSSGQPFPKNLPQRIVELLAKPKLIDLQENPVGHILEMLKAHYLDYRATEIPEIVATDEAERIVGSKLQGIPQDYIHTVDDGHFLRFDTTLPLLIASKGIGAPARVSAAGQVYRNQAPSPTRAQSFHQFELLLLDRAELMDPWQFTGQTLHAVSDLLPGRDTMIAAVNFPECSRAWEISVEIDGKWLVVLSWGIYNDAVLRYLGGNPARDRAFGLGYGLERMAALHLGYDDIRKLEAAKV